jgi:CRISPR-associated protein Cmr5
MNDMHQSIHKTLDQIRAGKAWAFVKVAKKQFKKQEEYDKYVSLVKKFPAIINNNGLGQALAFIFSKAKKTSNPEGLLFAQLQEWLTDNKDEALKPYVPPYPRKNSHESPDDYLLQCIMKHNSSFYLHATHESMTILDKMRNFAAGISDSPKKEE